MQLPSGSLFTLKFCFRYDFLPLFFACALFSLLVQLLIVGRGEGGGGACFKLLFYFNL